MLPREFSRYETSDSNRRRCARIFRSDSIGRLSKTEYFVIQPIERVASIIQIASNSYN